MIKLLPTEESRIHLESLDPKNKELIFFPLNNIEANFSDGTHWSLVVYSKKEDAFFSFDSLGECTILPPHIRSHKKEIRN